MNKPHERKPTDPGAYIGQNPERAADSIPGGVQPEDERVAAHSTQSGPTIAPEASGHRESPVGDDEVREAGQDR